MTSSNVVVSARRYISVVWVLAWPNHNATFRMSPVERSIMSAHECLLYLRRYSRHYVSRLTAVSGGVDPRNYGGEVRIPGEAGWRRPRPVLGARLERRIGGQRFRWQRFGLVPMCMA